MDLTLAGLTHFRLPNHFNGVSYTSHLGTAIMTEASASQAPSHLPSKGSALAVLTTQPGL